jgi:hypothetical protein
MNQSTFVKLGLITFGLVIVNFIILGFGRALVSFEAARLAAAPVTIITVGLMGYLFVRAVLAKLGIWEIRPDEADS